MKPEEKKYQIDKPAADIHQENEAPKEASGEQITSFTLFMKIGIIVLSIIAIIGFGIKVLPNAVTVSSTGSKRDLPIYCVDTEDKKVALSFDAAWGNDR